MKYAIITTNPQRDCIEAKNIKELYSEKSKIIREGYTIKRIEIVCDCKPEDLFSYGCMCGAREAIL